MPIRPHSVAVCAIVLLCAQAAFVSAAKQIEDADVTLYGVHEPPFSYSLLEQEAAGIHAYHPAKDGEGLPNRPVAAFPFEAPALPTDFPIPREHFQTAPPPAVQRNPYDSSEYARNAALLEQESQIRRGGLRMPYAAAGMAVPRPYLANSAGAAPVMPMQQMAMASPPMMMQQQPQPIYYAAPQPQLTAVAVPIQVPVAPILVEQKASARQEPELNALPAQSTIPLDADSQQETEDIASATADPATEMPEARFAQQAPGSKSMSTDSASSLASAAQSQSAGAPIAVDSASAGSASIGSSSSGSTPAAPSNRRRKLYKCNPAGTHCKVRFGNDIKWKMVTVPKLPDDGSSKQSQSQSGSQSGSSSAAGSQSGSGSEIQQPQYSDNPEIARLQRAYFEKQQEIARETKWVANVRKIIAEYQEKVRNVARHALVDKQDLRRQEKDIQAAIRKERQAKLEVELRAALESLQKLESTSSALSSKVSDLTNTKLNLRRTISKIQRAMGSNVRANVQDAAASLLEVNGGAAPSSDDSLNEKQDASDNAKQLFSSLLELLEHREKSNAHAEKQDHSHDSHHRSLAHRMLRGRTAEPVEKMSEVDDLKLLETNSAAFDERVHDIASQYADEERQRLDADLPLSTLALRDKHEIEKDLDDI